MTTLKNLIDVSGAAKILGVTPSRVRALIEAKKLKSAPLFGKKILDRREVEKFAKRKRPRGRPKKKNIFSPK